ncbi:MAG: hypothetical protein WBY75_19795 [Terracidiphilus sp.]
MKLLPIAFAMCFCLPVLAQTPASTGHDPFQNMKFLEGTWDANVQNNAAVKRSGRYTFDRELSGRILARHSTNDPNCSAPENFDCAHSDVLYVFQDGPGLELKAIYFDNEGHVIHYNVTTPKPQSVVFLSDTAQGPRFRLEYELSGTVMTGRFSMQMPGEDDWRTYLEWSGESHKR